MFKRKPIVAEVADAVLNRAEAAIHDAFSIPAAEPEMVGLLAEDINQIRGKLIELDTLRDRCEQLLQETQNKLNEINTSIAGYNAAIYIMTANETALPSRADGGENIVMVHNNITVAGEETAFAESERVSRTLEEQAKKATAKGKQ